MLSTIFIQAVTNIEDLAKDWKEKLLDEEQFKNSIYQAANDLILDQEMEGRIGPNGETENEILSSKLSIHCSVCKKLWLVGDRERTEQEKDEWICPDCLDRIKSDEAKEDEYFAKKADEDAQRVLEDGLL